jgi:hypothetical protein
MDIVKVYSSVDPGGVRSVAEIFSENLVRTYYIFR